MTVYYVTMTITSVCNLERRAPITWAGEIVHDEDALHDDSFMHRAYIHALDLTTRSWHRKYIGISADGFVVDNYTVLRCAD